MAGRSHPPPPPPPPPPPLPIATQTASAASQVFFPNAMDFQHHHHRHSTRSRSTSTASPTVRSSVAAYQNYRRRIPISRSRTSTLGGGRRPSTCGGCHCGGSAAGKSATMDPAALRDGELISCAVAFSFRKGRREDYVIIRAPLLRESGE